MNLKSKKAAVPLIALIGMSLIGGIAVRATVETAKSGVLKQNGKKIWCNFLNKGKDYCDSRYK